MAKRKRSTISPEAKATRRMRHREVRDVVNKLRKKYRKNLVDKFMLENYFLQPNSVTDILVGCDDKPVDPDTASLQYKAVMMNNINL